MTASTEGKSVRLTHIAAAMAATGTKSVAELAGVVQLDRRVIQRWIGQGEVSRLSGPAIGQLLHATGLRFEELFEVTEVRQ